MRSAALWSAPVLLALLLPGTAAADECDGPPAGGVTDPALATTTPTPVRLGMRIMRIEKIAEQDGNYAGELMLAHKWPAGGLRPNPQPRNALDISVSLDETRLRDELIRAHHKAQ